MLTVEDVIAAGARFSLATVRGATSWSPADFRLLGLPAAASLAGLLADVWLAGILPASSLGPLTCFLPKPQGGHRGIAIIDALYRVLLGAWRPTLAGWTQTRAAFNASKYPWKPGRGSVAILCT